MTGVTQNAEIVCYLSSTGGNVRNENSRHPIEVSLRALANIDRHEAKGGGDLVTRVLKHQGLWLTVTYLALILLMARAYA